MMSRTGPAAATCTRSTSGPRAAAAPGLNVLPGCRGSLPTAVEARSCRRLRHPCWFPCHAAVSKLHADAGAAASSSRRRASMVATRGRLGLHVHRCQQSLRCGSDRIANGHFWVVHLMRARPHRFCSRPPRSTTPSMHQWPAEIADSLRKQKSLSPTLRGAFAP